MRHFIVGVLLVLLLLTSCAQQEQATSRILSMSEQDDTSANVVSRESHELSEEIRFRNIEWGIGPDAVCNRLDDCAFTYFENQNMRTWENVDGWTGDYVVKPYGHYLFDMVSDDVAGYPLREVELFFMYDIVDGEVDHKIENEKLYLAKYSFSVLDIDSAYIDLQGKLSSLYGSGEETFKANSRFSVSLTDGGSSGRYTISQKSTVWYGSNNTAVKLISRTSDNNELGAFDVGLWIIYGKTDCARDLSILSDLLTAEAVREEGENRDTENIKGL